MLDQMLEDRDANLDDLKMHLLCAQHKMKAYTDLSDIKKHLRLEI